jgi:carboxymethylenebutenolidase
MNMHRTTRVVLITLAAVATVAAIVISQRSAPTVAHASGLLHTTHVNAAAEHIAAMAAAGDIHAGHALDEMRLAAAGVQSPAAPSNLKLPADNEGAPARLAASPRKGEFVTIDVSGTPMRTWVVQPQGQGKVPVVIVIQEVFGLTDWIRGVADQVAAEGFIAVAPDLLANRGANGGDTRAFASQQEAVQATLATPPGEMMAKLKAARQWSLKLPRSNGKTASVGFCFGGSQSFALAANEAALNAAVVYYGSAPNDAPPAAPGAPPPPFVPGAALTNIKAPVLGLYGGLKEDARIGNTIAATQAKMKELRKTFEPHVYEGAAHGFLRAQSGNNGANMRASLEAWPLTVAWIKKYAS